MTQDVVDEPIQQLNNFTSGKYKVNIYKNVDKKYSRWRPVSPHLENRARFIWQSIPCQGFTRSKPKISRHQDRVSKPDFFLATKGDSKLQNLGGRWLPKID